MKSYKLKIDTAKDKLTMLTGVVNEIGHDLTIIDKYYKQNDLEIGELSNVLSSLAVIVEYLNNTNEELDSVNSTVANTIEERESQEYLKKK